MTRTELPWLLMGRLVRPFPLAASLACLLTSINILSGSSVWGDGDTLSLAAAVAGIAGFVLLWVGFWARSTVAMQHGLMVTAVLFSARAATIWMEGNVLTALLAWCWTLAAAGAWLLERTTGQWDAGRGRGRGE